MLNQERFPEYFKAIHGVSPFPWQVRLLDSVVRDNAWPLSLDLPTASGKTAILDISVFALACGAKIPRRTVLVVDRRVVVDDAFARAREIRQAIHGGKDKECQGTILNDVRAALESLGGESALEIALLRGGMYREETWARHPATPLLICSTVDQIGSRLLHQGYGVSPHMRSIHAGLLANDALIILDEAHTSEPFHQTLEWISRYRILASHPLSLPFSFLCMTATPRSEIPAFRLNAEDRRNPVLARRLAAKKLIQLHSASTAKEAGFVTCMLDCIRPLTKTPGTTILVVANRVSTARKIADTLMKEMTGGKNSLQIVEPVLLTGRSRPLERDRLLENARPRLFAGRKRDLLSNEKSLVVIATQCIEVGADLDADALVTEIAPIDSLRQRLGRLDRLGELGTSNVAIVAPKELAEHVGDKPFVDPIYGDAGRATWQWLQNAMSGTTVDGGIDSFDILLSNTDPKTLSAMRTPTSDAPIMLPGYCDLWVQTSPQPSILPEPSLFLHGLKRSEGEVQIVWRADLPEDLPETWGAAIANTPPMPGEALSIPISRVRLWLSGESVESGSGSDLEGEASTEFELKKATQDKKKIFLIWKGEETQTPTDDSSLLRIGDTIIMPCDAGGCDSWGWAPGSTEPVVDLVDLARYKAHKPPLLRLHPSCNQQLPQVLRDLGTCSQEPDPDDHESPAAHAQSVLMAIDPDIDVTEELAAAITALRGSKHVNMEPHPSGTGWILTGDLAMNTQEGSIGRGDVSSEDDLASVRSIPVKLYDHLSHVRLKARSIADSVSLPDVIQRDIALAACLHDFGKADPRFQALLNGGDQFLAVRQGLLAKSPRMKGKGYARPDDGGSSGYPQGARHELLSLQLVAGSRYLEGKAEDKELVLHLVASHHGRCRPFAPVITDPKPRPVQIEWENTTFTASSDCTRDNINVAHAGSGVSERFWHLVRKYGWWGLSYLEACVRLADHRASAEEEENPR